MNRQGHENIEWFLGPEVEHSPAHGKKTLFVVGYQEPETVVQKARDNKVTHIYLGANHSFDPSLVSKGNAGKAWNNLIQELLSRGFFVTIDYEANQHVTVLPMFDLSVWSSRQFIPMLSVRIPRVETTSPNLTIKIDDVDFQATNDGVWCMNYREVTDSNRFTSWQEYQNDLPIGEVKPTSMPPYVESPTKPATAPIDLKTLKKVESPIINDNSLGLDPESTSALKSEEHADNKDEKTALNTSPADITEAYTTPAKKTKK